jgi:hypothetical protein
MMKFNGPFCWGARGQIQTPVRNRRDRLGKLSHRALRGEQGSAISRLRFALCRVAWPRGGVVTQRTANPCTPVRFRARPPSFSVRRAAVSFDAAAGLHFKPGFAKTAAQFPGSSVVEQAAVNRSVAGSNPARGANFPIQRRASGALLSAFSCIAICGRAVHHRKALAPHGFRRQPDEPAAGR